jgi:hypothetical protein
MKNALLNAAMYMAAPFGLRVHAWKLDQKMDCDLPTLVEAIKPYAQPAIEFYEIGEEVAMGDPSDPYRSFGEFANWFAAYIKDNHKYPEQEQAMHMLGELTFISFTGGLTRDQDTILKRRLDAEVKEYADE